MSLDSQEIADLAAMVADTGETIEVVGVDSEGKPTSREIKAFIERGGLDSFGLGLSGEKWALYDLRIWVGRGDLSAAIPNETKFNIYKRIGDENMTAVVVGEVLHSDEACFILGVY